MQLVSVSVPPAALLQSTPPPLLTAELPLMVQSVSVIDAAIVVQAAAACRCCPR